MGAAAKDAISHQPLVHDARSADAFDLVQRVGLRAAFGVAALDDDNPHPFAIQFPRDRRTRRAAADNAEISLDGLAGRNISEVNYRHLHHVQKGLSCPCG